MKFPQFLRLQESLLLEDSRIQNLNIKDFKVFAEFCKKNDFNDSLKKMIENEVFFFRGQNKTNKDIKFFLMDPSGIERNSLTKLPFTYLYNSMINTKSDWKDYPNRNKSVIFTNNLEYAETYGEPFIVVPQRGRIGICPTEDMFTSFKNIKIDDISDTAYYIMPKNELDNKLNNKTDWESLKKILFDIFLEKLKSIYDKMANNLFVKNFLIELENRDYEGFSKVLDNLFTPRNLGFNVIKFPDEINKLKYNFNNELWTDAKCLLIAVEKGEDYLDFLKNEIYPILK